MSTCPLPWKLVVERVEPVVAVWVEPVAADVQVVVRVQVVVPVHLALDNAHCYTQGDSVVVEEAWDHLDVKIAVHTRSKRSNPSPVDSKGLAVHWEAEGGADHAVIFGFQPVVR